MFNHSTASKIHDPEDFKREGATFTTEKNGKEVIAWWNRIYDIADTIRTLAEFPNPIVESDKKSELRWRSALSALSTIRALTRLGRDSLDTEFRSAQQLDEAVPYCQVVSSRGDMFGPFSLSEHGTETLDRWSKIYEDFKTIDDFAMIGQGVDDYNNCLAAQWSFMFNALARIYEYNRSIIQEIKAACPESQPFIEVDE